MLSKLHFVEQVDSYFFNLKGLKKQIKEFFKKNFLKSSFTFNQNHKESCDFHIILSLEKKENAVKGALDLFTNSKSKAFFIQRVSSNKINIISANPDKKINIQKSQALSKLKDCFKDLKGNLRFSIIGNGDGSLFGSFTVEALIEEIKSITENLPFQKIEKLNLELIGCELNKKINLNETSYAKKFHKEIAKSFQKENLKNYTTHAWSDKIFINEKGQVLPFFDKSHSTNSKFHFSTLYGLDHREKITENKVYINPFLLKNLNTQGRRHLGVDDLVPLNGSGGNDDLENQNHLAKILGELSLFQIFNSLFKEDIKERRNKKLEDFLERIKMSQDDFYNSLQLEEDRDKYTLEAFDKAIKEVYNELLASLGNEQKEIGKLLSEHISLSHFLELEKQELDKLKTLNEDKEKIISKKEKIEKLEKQIISKKEEIEKTSNKSIQKINDTLKKSTEKTKSPNKSLIKNQVAIIFSSIENYWAKEYKTLSTVLSPQFEIFIVGDIIEKAFVSAIKIINSDHSPLSQQTSLQALRNLVKLSLTQNIDFENADLLIESYKHLKDSSFLASDKEVAFIKQGIKEDRVVKSLFNQFRESNYIDSIIDLNQMEGLITELRKVKNSSKETVFNKILNLFNKSSENLKIDKENLLRFYNESKEILSHLPTQLDQENFNQKNIENSRVKKLTADSLIYILVDEVQGNRDIEEKFKAAQDSFTQKQREELESLTSSLREDLTKRSEAKKAYDLIVDKVLETIFLEFLKNDPQSFDMVKQNPKKFLANSISLREKETLVKLFIDNWDKRSDRESYKLFLNQSAQIIFKKAQIGDFLEKSVLNNTFILDNLFQVKKLYVEFINTNEKIKRQLPEIYDKIAPHLKTEIQNKDEALKKINDRYIDEGWQDRITKDFVLSNKVIPKENSFDIIVHIPQDNSNDIFPNAVDRFRKDVKNKILVQLHDDRRNSKNQEFIKSIWYHNEKTGKLVVYDDINKPLNKSDQDHPTKLNFKDNNFDKMSLSQKELKAKLKEITSTNYKEKAYYTKLTFNAHGNRNMFARYTDGAEFVKKIVDPILSILPKKDIIKKFAFNPAGCLVASPINKLLNMDLYGTLYNKKKIIKGNFIYDVLTSTTNALEDKRFTYSNTEISKHSKISASFFTLSNYNGRNTFNVSSSSLFSDFFHPYYDDSNIINIIKSNGTERMLVEGFLPVGQTLVYNANGEIEIKNKRGRRLIEITTNLSDTRSDFFVLNQVSIREIDSLHNFLSNYQGQQLTQALVSPTPEDSISQYRTPENEKVIAKNFSTTEFLSSEVESLRKNHNISDEFTYIGTKNNEVRFVKKDEFTILPNGDFELKKATFENTDSSNKRAITLSKNHPIVEVETQNKRWMGLLGLETFNNKGLEISTNSLIPALNKELISNLVQINEYKLPFLRNRIYGGLDKFNTYSNHLIAFYGVLNGIKSLIDWSSKSPEENKNASASEKWDLANTIYGLTSLPLQPFIEKGVPVLAQKLAPVLQKRISYLAQKLAPVLARKLAPVLSTSFAVNFSSFKVNFPKVTGVGFGILNLGFDIHNLKSSIQSLQEISKLNDSELISLAKANVALNVIQIGLSVVSIVGVVVGLGMIASISLGIIGIGLFIGAMIVSLFMQKRQLKIQKEELKKKLFEIFQFFTSIKISIIDENNKVRSFIEDQNNKLLYFPTQAVIKFIDLQNNKMQFGDVNLYPVTNNEKHDKSPKEYALLRSDDKSPKIDTQASQNALSLYNPYLEEVIPNFKQNQEFDFVQNQKLLNHSILLLPYSLSGIYNYSYFNSPLKGGDGYISLEDINSTKQKNEKTKSIAAARKIDNYYKSQSNYHFSLIYLLRGEERIIKRPTYRAARCIKGYTYFYNPEFIAKDTSIEIVLDDLKKDLRTLIIQDAAEIYKNQIARAIEEKEKRRKVLLFSAKTNENIKEHESLRRDISDLRAYYFGLEFKKEIEKIKANSKSHLSYKFIGNGGNYLLKISKMELKEIKIQAQNKDNWSFDLSELDFNMILAYSSSKNEDAIKNIKELRQWNSLKEINYDVEAVAEVDLPEIKDKEEIKKGFTYLANRDPFDKMKTFTTYFVFSKTKCVWFSIELNYIPTDLNPKEFKSQKIKTYNLTQLKFLKNIDYEVKAILRLPNKKNEYYFFSKTKYIHLKWDFIFNGENWDLKPELIGSAKFINKDWNSLKEINCKIEGVLEDPEKKDQYYFFSKKHYVHIKLTASEKGEYNNELVGNEEKLKTIQSKWTSLKKLESFNLKSVFPIKRSSFQAQNMGVEEKEAYLFLTYEPKKRFSFKENLLEIPYFNLDKGEIFYKIQFIGNRFSFIINVDGISNYFSSISFLIEKNQEEILFTPVLKKNKELLKFILRSPQSALTDLKQILSRMPFEKKSYLKSSFTLTGKYDQTDTKISLLFSSLNDPYFTLSIAEKENNFKFFKNNSYLKSILTWLNKTLPSSFKEKEIYIFGNINYSDSESTFQVIYSPGNKKIELFSIKSFSNSNSRLNAGDMFIYHGESGMAFYHLAKNAFESSLPEFIHTEYIIEDKEISLFGRLKKEEIEKNIGIINFDEFKEVKTQITHASSSKTYEEINFKDLKTSFEKWQLSNFLENPEFIFFKGQDFEMHIGNEKINFLNLNIKNVTKQEFETSKLDKANLGDLFKLENKFYPEEINFKLTIKDSDTAILSKINKATLIKNIENKENLAISHTNEVLINSTYENFKKSKVRASFFETISILIDKKAYNYSWISLKGQDFCDILDTTSGKWLIAQKAEGKEMLVGEIARFNSEKKLVWMTYTFGTFTIDYMYDLNDKQISEFEIKFPKKEFEDFINTNQIPLSLFGHDFTKFLQNRNLLLPSLRLKVINKEKEERFESQLAIFELKDNSSFSFAFYEEKLKESKIKYSYDNKSKHVEILNANNTDKLFYIKPKEIYFDFRGKGMEKPSSFINAYYKENDHLDFIFDKSSTTKDALDIISYSLDSSHIKSLSIYFLRDTNVLQFEYWESYGFWGSLEDYIISLDGKDMILKNQKNDFIIKLVEVLGKEKTLKESFFVTKENKTSLNSKTFSLIELLKKLKYEDHLGLIGHDKEENKYFYSELSGWKKQNPNLEEEYIYINEAPAKNQTYLEEKGLLLGESNLAYKWENGALKLVGREEKGEFKKLNLLFSNSQKMNSQKINFENKIFQIYYKFNHLGDPTVAKIEEKFNEKNILRQSALLTKGNFISLKEENAFLIYDYFSKVFFIFPGSPLKDKNFLGAAGREKILVMPNQKMEDYNTYLDLEIDFNYEIKLKADSIVIENLVILYEYNEAFKENYSSIEVNQSNLNEFRQKNIYLFFILEKIISYFGHYINIKKINLKISSINAFYKNTKLD